MTRYASLEPDTPLGPEFDLIGRLAAELEAGAFSLPEEVAGSLAVGLGDDAGITKATPQHGFMHGVWAKILRRRTVCWLPCHDRACQRG